MGNCGIGCKSAVTVRKREDLAHDLYVGNIGIHGSYAANMAVSRCDVLFAVGTRFNDRITGKTQQFAPDAKLVHIDIQPANISKNIAADLAVVADAKAAMNTTAVANS